MTQLLVAFFKRCNCLLSCYFMYKCVYSYPIQALQALWAPRGWGSQRRRKVVWLSALRTGRLYPKGDIPGAHFC